MKPLATTSLFNNFFPQNILAYVSDRECDFILRDNQSDFSQLQKDFISARFGRMFPEVFFVRQVHGHHVAMAKFSKGRVLEEADAIVTNKIDLPIAIRTADCLPIFIFDPTHNVIALVHAGWRSSYEKIVAKTLEFMRTNWSTEPKDIQSAFGPAIQACCYEVGAEFVERFPKDIETREEKRYLNLAQFNKRELVNHGLYEERILDCKICTHCSEQYFSFRKEKEKAGRMLSLMMLRK